MKDFNIAAFNTLIDNDEIISKIDTSDNYRYKGLDSTSFYCVFNDESCQVPI